MKTALIDVNVVLDVLLDREPHVRASAAVWAAIECGKAKGMLSGHAVTTIHYLVRKETGNTAKATRTIAALLKVFGVAAVGQSVIERAPDVAASDFEDAVTAAAAAAAGCDLIVTRDPKGFLKSPVQAVTPEAAAYILSTV
ncbi:MAG TPA: PIN domain-containing protein [Bryobacteraceae bacterium]|nr:PIN domain-containing protein [Bryobacteraceae bacterium]